MRSTHRDMSAADVVHLGVATNPALPGATLAIAIPLVAMKPNEDMSFPAFAVAPEPELITIIGLGSPCYGTADIKLAAVVTSPRSQLPVDG